MSTAQAVSKFKTQFFNQGTPEFHVVLGSGFGAALDLWDSKSAWEIVSELSFEALPTLVPSTVPDHSGKYRLVRHRKSGKLAIVQMGRLHGYEGLTSRQVVQTVMIPRLAGIKNFVLTNAAGGLGANFKGGDVMVIEDHVNLTGGNPLVGANPLSLDGRELGPRFPDLSQLYRREFRRGLGESLSKTGLTVHQGIYLGLLGPCFETPAEVKLYGQWGMHAVGMSTVWEAIALNHSGASIAGMSLISNLACGLGDGQPLDHHKIVETCRESAKRIVDGVLGWIESRSDAQSAVK